MEIIEIIIFLCLFFNLGYQTTFISVISYYSFMYYKTNKFVLMSNPHAFNVFILFAIVVYESVSLFLRLTFYDLTSNKTFQYFYNKIDNMNKYYLEKKNTMILYFLISKKAVFDYFCSKKISNINTNIKINKINSNEDAFMFLKSLKTK